MARDVGEIQIYDQIGESTDWWTGEKLGMSPAKLRQAIKDMGDVRRIDVRLNSPGGIASDGIAMMNILKEAGVPVHVHVDGIAASAASIIAMAGNKVIMKEGSMLMIHRAMNIIAGNANDMRKEAQILDKFDGEMAGIYARRAKSEPEKFLSLMDAESWLTAKEAIELGLADESIAEPAKVEAKAVARMAFYGFRNIPSEIKAVFTGTVTPQAAQPNKEGSMPDPKDPKEGGGQSNQAAPAALTAEQVAAQIADATAKAEAKAEAKMQAELQRRSAILAKAREFKQEALGEKLIADKTPESQAIIALQTAHIEALTKAAAPNPGPNPPEMTPQAKAIEEAGAESLKKIQAKRQGR